MNPTPKVVECLCGQKKFFLRIERAERAGLLTCESGHHSFLLDSRDYWMDIIQDGRPKQSKCRCGETLFRVGLIYHYRDSGDVRTVSVIWRCPSCKRDSVPLEIDIKYSPTDQLVSRPLDPIDDPWLRPKRLQITVYWLPEDAERFSTFLVERLGARVFESRSFTEYFPRELRQIAFLPELKRELFFTNLPAIIPPPHSDPQESAPFLKLSSPFHMAWQEKLSHLHYIEYAKEVLVSMRVAKQPAHFVSFAHSAQEWLFDNYISKRDKKTADNPEEYERVFGAK